MVKFSIAILLYVVEVIDYNNEKVIPNFFMGEYSISNVESYWTGVLCIRRFF